VKSFPGHVVPAVSPFYSKLLTGVSIALLVLAGTALRGADLPAPFVVNLPFEANQATPIWLGHPATPQTTFARVDLPISPPDPSASLLVTVYFQEKEGGFLRISWATPDGVQVLSDNFFEGTGMSNQRSLLITPDILTGEGTLSFQCGDTTMSIQRIKLEWLANRSGLVSPLVQDLLVTPALGLTLSAPSLNGQPQLADPAAWHDQIVTVPITDKPTRIEQGVEFSVQMDNVPASGRLALEEAGLPLGKHLVVWINQQRAGTFSPAVPDLVDEGYFTGKNAPQTYVGWRDGSFYVPASILKTGVNAVQFSVEDDCPPTDGNVTDPGAAPAFPLAVKNLVLQLDYPPPTPDNANAASVPSSTEPTGPASSDPRASSSTSTEINVP